MIQLAGLIEINGAIKERVNLFFRPLSTHLIEDEALEVNKRTREEIQEFPHLAVGIASLKKTLGKYVDKFDRDDKFVPAGFNVGFDCDFLRQGFYDAGDKYGIGTWMFNCKIDVVSWVGCMVAECNLRCANYKLVTICERFGIDFKGGAHDALADVEATRALYLACKEGLRP